jgi:hypothetical protein
VCLAEQPQTERQPARGVQHVIDSPQVVVHLPDVIVPARAGLLHLEEHQLRQRRLDALDPAGQDHLPAQQRP